jgi:RNA exonuclease 1
MDVAMVLSASRLIKQDDEPLVKKMRTENQFSGGGEVISDEQYKLLKKDVVVRRNQILATPKIRLKQPGEQASLATEASKRQPLIFEDIQSLLMSAILKNCSPTKPERWCTLEKTSKISHTVIILIDGPTCYNYTANEKLFVNTKAIFEHQLEVSLANEKVIKELLLIPWIQSNKKRLIDTFGTLDAALISDKNPNAVVNKFFSMDGEVDNHDTTGEKNSVEDVFPRTRLLLSPLQMLVEGFPMPFQNDSRFRSYRPTKTRYKPVSSSSQMFGLDCEMVRSINAENELARVSIVDENCESVYETLVRPDSKIVNYLTQWSGITKEMMASATKTLKEVQEDVCNLLPPDAILVGQSLNCDLNAMKLMHPYVIDTSIIYNMTGVRNRKSKLQLLAKHFLGESIQADEKGHSSIEDSTTCMKLAKLKLSKNIYFGDLVLQNKYALANVKIEQTLEKPEEQPLEKPEEKPPLKKIKSALITSQNTVINLEKLLSADHDVEHLKELSVKQSIQTARKVAASTDFCLSYMNVLDEMAASGYQNDANDVDENISKYAPSIDKHIYKVWGKVAKGGLFVVIFGGRGENNANGLAMVQVKT